MTNERGKGEQIHVPGSTFLPLVTALGLALAVLGLLLSLAMLITGSAILLYCVIRWIADCRSDIRKLPQRSQRSYW